MQSFRKLLDFTTKAHATIIEKSCAALSCLQCAYSGQQEQKPAMQQSPCSSFPTAQPTQSTHHHHHQYQYQDCSSPTHLQKLKHQRRHILQHIKKLNSEITELTDYDPTSKFHQYMQISTDPEAYDHAYRLIQRMETQKKQLIDRKERDEAARRDKVERQRRQAEQLIEDRVAEARELRREAILKRMEQERKRHKDLKAMDRLSNSLVREIRNSHNNLCEEKAVFGTIDIGMADKMIISRKQSKQVTEKSHSKSPEESVKSRKYPKGKFAYIIEEEQKQRKEQIQVRRNRRHSQLERRKKYGQLVTSLLPKNMQGSKHEITSAVTATPKKSTTQTIQQRKGSYVASREKKRAATEPTEGAQLTKIQIQRLERQKQLRKRTNQRIRELEQMDEEINKIQRPFTNKYKNYIRYQPRKKNYDQIQTKKIIENSNLSGEDKYMEIMNRASLLEHKAKIKQQTKGDNQEALGCIVASIHAKIALLGTL